MIKGLILWVPTGRFQTQWGMMLAGDLPSHSEEVVSYLVT